MQLFKFRRNNLLRPIHALPSLSATQQVYRDSLTRPSLKCTIGGEFLWCTYFIDKLFKFLSSFWNKCLLLDLHALKVFSLWLVICTKRERGGTECLLIVGTIVQRIHCSVIYNGKFAHLVITDPRFVRISLDEFGLSLSISALRPISCFSLYPQQ